jgi:hypothetical protein
MKTDIVDFPGGPAIRPGLFQGLEAPDVLPERAPTTSSPSPGWLRVVASLGGAVGIALAFPFFVVGLPFALAWRAVLASTKWRSPNS